MSTTIYTNPSFADVPFGLKLQQTITSSGSVTIPSNIKRVFAVCIGGGASGSVMSPYTTASITNAVSSGGVTTYTCNNSFFVGDRVSITGINPTAFNISTGNPLVIATASATQFTVNTTITGTYVSGGTAISGGAGGGGGAGGIAMGWTYATDTCIVAAGGIGITGFTIGNGGGITQYGQIVAGNGGAPMHAIAAVTGSRAPTFGGAGGGQCDTASTSQSTTAGAAGYNSASTQGFAWSLNYGGTGGRVSASRDPSGVAGGGGAGVTGVGINLTISGTGVFGFHAGGGGGAGYSTTGTSMGGAGGNSDFYTGGSGTTGTTNSAGAGGGGAGMAGNGGNASGVTGGTGGLGGGGGGAGASDVTLGTSGSGGAGIIYLYY